MNIYYSPEKSGLRIVGELEENLDYAFKKVVVWQHIASGILRWGWDSGCSCPLPFEDITEFDNLEKLPETMGSFKMSVDELTDGVTATERLEFVRMIEELVERGEHS